MRSLAKQIGCSAATVSRALRHDPRLSDATISRVMAAAAVAGFPRSHGLATGSNDRLVLVLLHELKGSGVGNHADALTGLRLAARRAHVAVAVHHHQAGGLAELRSDHRFADIIENPRLSGIVVMGGCSLPIATYLSARAPLVSMGHDLPLLASDAVQADHQRSAETLVEHLAQLGHRRIAIAAGSGDDAPTRDRLSGYRTAMLRLGLPYDPTWEVRHPGDILRVSDRKRILSLTGHGITAWLVARNDGGALIIDALEQAGWSVPEQVSVVGFHHVGLLTDGRRPTACPIPFARLGQELLGSIMDRWQARSGGRRILITCPLVVGDTTDAPPS